MIGYDFSVFWKAAQAMLNGGSPYTVFAFWYPPAFPLLFAGFGLLPFLPAYGLWTGINIVFCLSIFRRLNLSRPSWTWLAFSPVVFNLFSGNVDLFYLWLTPFLSRKDWKAVAAAVLMTVKPQIALILLPWFLVRWLKSSPRLVAWWLAGSLALNLLPLLFQPAIFQGWVGALQASTGMKISLSSGIFTLTTFGLPLWLAVVIAVPIAIWGLFQDETTSRAAQLLVCPVTFWYEDVFLAGSVPPLLLIPFSLLAFLASFLLQNSLPLATIPLAVLAYRLVVQRQERLAGARLAARS